MTSQTVSRKDCTRVRRRRRDKRRGIALILVLGALTVLTVMLTEFQDETAAELGSALSARDQLKAEYAARSAINLSRLLIASEPTIRKALLPIGMMLFQGQMPQIPVWEFANQVLGAFNDKEGNQDFAALAGVDVANGKNLGLEGAGFDLKIVDEDSKIDLNVGAHGDAFSEARLATELMGLMAGPQYDPMFENPDPDGAYSDRRTICGAIIDWTDSDQEAYVCDPNSGSAVQGGAEDSFYQLLPKPYMRKNAAFDSLQELHLVRGISDDFWDTFVDPDPDDPDKRTVTVWGQGKVNVNTANPQTLMAVICGNAPQSAACTDPTEAVKYLSFLGILHSMTMGAPIFGSPKVFVQALEGQGMTAAIFSAVGLKPIELLSASQTLKAITTESKVFSIYATGHVTAGKRETRVRIHEVVDFRGAPPPLAPIVANALAGAADQNGQNAQTQPTTTQSSTSKLPAGASDDAIAAAFQPSPAGNVLYYRMN
jgi:general secretion pathway protein K